MKYYNEYRGNVQIIEEEHLGQSLLYFLKLLEDRPGIIISRRHPKALRQDFDIPNVDIYWLTSIFDVHNNILPSNIPRLNNVISGFIEKNPNGVVLFEGLEYLIVNNGFNPMIRFIQYLRDKVAITNGLILISLDPLAFPLKELHLIKIEGSTVDANLVAEIIEEVEIKSKRARI